MNRVALAWVGHFGREKVTRLSIKACMLIVALGLTPQVGADVRLAPWSEGVFAQIEREHGPAAAQRMRTIYELVQANRDRPLEEKLRLANDTLNELPWIADREKYSTDDYWATPFETLTTFGGDCEDMAIGKLVMLRLMGVPKESLQLGYVKVKKTGEIHMVLVWVSEDRTETLVLDNLVKQIMPGKARTDLLAVYLADPDGNVTLISDDGKQRSVKGVVPKTKMEKLQKVRQRMAANQAKYVEYNEGKPLFIEVR